VDKPATIRYTRCADVKSVPRSSAPITVVAAFSRQLPFRSYIAMNFIRDAKSRLSIFGELWAFMKVRKKWWLGPIMIFLLLLGVLIVFTEGSALAPFIYALF
jgi:hypothetical protein